MVKWEKLDDDTYQGVESVGVTHKITLPSFLKQGNIYQVTVRKIKVDTSKLHALKEFLNSESEKHE